MKLHGVIFEPKYLILLSDYKNMMTLKQFLKNVQLSKKEAKRIFLKVAKMILECHKRKIAHRDIKLENILIDSKLNVDLIDFGYSIKLETKSDYMSIRYCGTPLYMAPELIVRGVYNRRFCICTVTVFGICYFIYFKGIWFADSVFIYKMI